MNQSLTSHIAGHLWTTSSIQWNEGAGYNWHYAHAALIPSIQIKIISVYFQCGFTGTGSLFDVGVTAGIPVFFVCEDLYGDDNVHAFGQINANTSTAIIDIPQTTNPTYRKWVAHFIVPYIV